MSKIKIIFISLLIPFFILIISTLIKIKNREDFQHKKVLAQEIHKVLGVLMLDLRDARESSIQDVPADGQWYGHIAFENDQLGPVEYMTNNGHLMRLNHGQRLLIADHIKEIHIRRQQGSPTLIEVQIEAHTDVSLESNFKIRIRE
jgi:hypothetical protein